MDKGLTVPKWVLINQPKTTQMLQNLSAQIVGPRPKVWNFDEKKSHWVPVVNGFTNLTIQAVFIYTTYLASIQKVFFELVFYFKNCSSDRENFSLWSSLDEFIQIMKDQNNLLNRIPFNFLLEANKDMYSNSIGTNNWDVKTCRNKLEKHFLNFLINSRKKLICDY